MIDSALLGQLLGPYALLVGALIAVGVLWRSREKAIADYIASLRATIVDRTSERDLALKGWQEQTAATNRVAETLEEDRRDRTARRRMGES